MDTSRLHILTTSLKDAEFELAGIERQLGFIDYDYVNGGEVINVAEFLLAAEDLGSLTERLNNIVDQTNTDIDYTDYHLEDTWWSVETKNTVSGVDTFLVLKSYKIFTPEQNENIRKVLLDRREHLVTMSLEYKAEIKSIVDGEDNV